MATATKNGRAKKAGSRKLKPLGSGKPPANGAAVVKAMQGLVGSTTPLPAPQDAREDKDGNLIFTPDELQLAPLVWLEIAEEFIDAGDAVHRTKVNGVPLVLRPNLAVNDEHTMELRKRLEEAGYWKGPPHGGDFKGPEPASPADREHAAEPVMPVIDTMVVPIGDMYPSPLNPRKHFDQVRLDQLAASMKRAHGMLQPIVVRSNPQKKGAGVWEICFGERRYRAATIAGLTHVPVRLIVITDEDLVDEMMIENVQREDLTPLELGRGYRQMIDNNPTKHSAVSIATRIGKSPEHVWSMMKLLDLVPEAQKLVEAGKIPAAQAILIARETAADQKRMIALPGSKSYGGYGDERHAALWVDAHEDGLLTSDEERAAEKADPYHGWKIKSEREVRAWVQTHIRFNPAHRAANDPLLFDTTKAALDEAVAQPGRGRKFVWITHEWQCPAGAKDPAERTYGCDAWKRADGARGSKPCDHSVLGIVAAGPEHGAAFKVCVNRDKCEVHWKADVQRKRAAAKRRANPPKAGAKGPKWEREQAAANKRWEEQRKREEEAKALFKRALPAIVESVAAAVKAAALGTITDRLVRILPYRRYMVEAARLLKAGKGLEDLVRSIILADLLADSDGWDAHEEFPKSCGPFGGGIAAALKAAAPKPEPKPQTPAEKKPAKKAAAGKKGKAAKKAKKKGGGK